VFFDEAVFSNPVYDMKVWYTSGKSLPSISMDKVRFKAVSCGAAINLDGEVVAYKTYDGAFNIERFLEYLQLLKMRTKEFPIYLVLDNLSVHKSLRVKNFCEEN